MRMIMLAASLLISSSARADLTKARCIQLAEIFTDLSDAVRNNEDAQEGANTSAAMINSSGNLKYIAVQSNAAEDNFLIDIPNYGCAFDDSIYELRRCAK
ncbi:hypothetical protein MKK84_04480 [Methylobacterium sp. E-065]|uniref:hypothetical protein n=1 Tax=Methylobacterium sp. E-065 TaxID=2836583 RepID=UPI001FBB6A5E|nr:hypothetical protein [Methylobacterium sp. E-065]MCJ2016688.1 hypothetical protein [Methylobacterium sp. E-065]